MRRNKSTTLLIACFLQAVGCHWAGLRDPVPASLAASRTLSSEGNELLEQRQLDKAEDKLAAAVNTCPTDCDARRYYAETLWLRGKPSAAIEQLEKVCQLSPDSDLRVRLAEMQLETGYLAAAERNIDQVLSRNSKLAAAWRVRGRVLRCIGNNLLAEGKFGRARAVYLEALADLHRAAGYDDKDRQVIGETAAAYRSLGQLEAAEHPARSDETAAMSRSLAWQQRALESMQSLLETYSPGEEPQQVLYQTALDYMALQRYDDAVAMYYSLAKAHYRNGQSQDAATALQQALAINPQHAPSQKLLSEIQVAQRGDPVLRR